MNYYIVDDNIAAVKILQNIIRVRGLGEVAGCSTDPESAVQEILRIRPDVVLVDLLMSGIDGVTLVSEVKEKSPNTNFVMISKVMDKKMVQSAYEAGVEFFINKPINVIEVERVLKGLEEKLSMQKIVSSIKELIPGESPQPAVPKTVPQPTNQISVFLGMLGMLGEKGSQDIRRMAQYMLENGQHFDRTVLEAAAAETGDTTRNIEQRARRAIKKGLTNAANAALDDYTGDIVDGYATYVFDFRTLKEEMDAVRGNGGSGGRVTLARFMDGLVAYCRNVSE
jgi:two-component system response regulator YcbB